MEWLAAVGVQISMAARGNPDEHAQVERFFKPLKPGRPARIVHTAVGMMKQSRRRLSRRHRHLKRRTICGTLRLSVGDGDGGGRL